MNTKNLNEPLEAAVQRVGLTGDAGSEMNLMWALCIGDPQLLSDLRHAGLTYESAMDEYHGIRDSKIQIHRVSALAPPTDYVLRAKSKSRMK